MPTNTPNFNLVKATQEEFYNVDVPNNNMDIIDRLLKELQDAISAGATEKELTALREVLAMHFADNIKHITNTERNNWNGKYVKPVLGIPKIDLEANVQTSLDRADTSIQESMRNKANGFIGLGPDGLPPAILGSKFFYEAFSLIGITIGPNSYWERRIPLLGKNQDFKFIYNRYSGSDLIFLTGTKAGVANNYLEENRSTANGYTHRITTNNASNVSFDFYNGGTLRMQSVYLDKVANEFVIRIVNPHATATSTIQTYGDYKLEVYYE
ncbi:hypothetical protein [Psychrobacillus sp. NPDC093200]|uniref:hypothetical protein n=1 Tax=Psychrobacillus sp. NPDC093200 TaxID=3390656 RepID=UPI003D056860